MIDVSVIIPVYNEEKYIGQCLDTLLAQTLKNIEIICVDDGSTDNTKGILKEYVDKDKRITILEQKNKGGGAARNLGLAKAKGRYLSFLDADDFFEPDMLEKIYKECKDNNADIGIYQVKFYHEATGAVTEEVHGLRTELLPEKKVFNYKDMPDYIFNAFHNWTWNKLFNREFVLRNNIKFQEIKRTNDLYFTTTSLVRADRIVTLQERLINYRVRISGNCQSTNQVSPYDFFEAFKALKKDLVDNNIYNEVKFSFVRHAMDGCVANLASSEFGEVHEEIFNRLKNDIFAEFDVIGDNVQEAMNGVDFEIEEDIYRRYKEIRDNDYKSYIILRGNELKQENMELKFNIYNTEQSIKNSSTFKVGRMVLALPAKIKRIINGNK